MRYFLIFILILLIFDTEDDLKQAKEDLKQIEERALCMPEKDCYDWQEIEVIIFGEIQE
ncbi:MAG: hypothetical protein KDH96_04730 [Candidatus Riesia sp.]|nr:hypothetical protein [Candidatus Riesia sp.]